MQLYSVEILNEEAIVLLQGLERLKAIRLIPYSIKKEKETTNEQPQKDLGEKYAGHISYRQAEKIKLSQKYRGAVSKELGEKLQDYIQKSREEWQEPIL